MSGERKEEPERMSQWEPGNCSSPALPDPRSWAGVGHPGRRTSILEQLTSAIGRRCWGSEHTVLRPAKASGRKKIASPSGCLPQHRPQTLPLALHCQSQVSQSHRASLTALASSIVMLCICSLYPTSTPPVSPLQTGTGKVLCWLLSVAQRRAGPEEFLLL